MTAAALRRRRGRAAKRGLGALRRHIERKDIGPWGPTWGKGRAAVIRPPKAQVDEVADLIVADVLQARAAVDHWTGVIVEEHVHGRMVEKAMPVVHTLVVPQAGPPKKVLISRLAKRPGGGTGPLCDGHYASRFETVEVEYNAAFPLDTKRNVATLRREVRKTVAHELAHAMDPNIHRPGAIKQYLAARKRAKLEGPAVAHKAYVNTDIEVAAIRAEVAHYVQTRGARRIYRNALRRGESRTDALKRVFAKHAWSAKFTPETRRKILGDASVWLEALEGGGRSARAPACPLVDVVEVYGPGGEIITEVRLRGSGQGNEDNDPFAQWCAEADAKEGDRKRKAEQEADRKRAVKAYQDGVAKGHLKPPAPTGAPGVGDLVWFGRARGEKTIGRITRAAGKKWKVQQLVARRDHPIGTEWGVPKSLVTWYTGPPLDLPLVQGAAPKPEFQPRRTARVRTHDLDALLAGEKRHFPDGMFDDVTIRWSSASRDQRQAGIRMATWHPTKREIKVHPNLDRPEVPAYVMRHLVCHELIHGLIGVRRNPRTGKRVIHGPDFKRLERAHPDHARASAWEKANMGCLLGRDDWSDE